MARRKEFQAFFLFLTVWVVGVGSAQEIVIPPQRLSFPQPSVGTLGTHRLDAVHAVRYTGVLSDIRAAIAQSGRKRRIEYRMS